MSSCSTREEAFAAITDFANKEQVSGAAVTAIGAFAHAEVGWFDLAAKRYKRIAVNEQCEVLSLIGDVAESDSGKASLHPHAVLGLRDGRCAVATSCQVQCGRRWKSRSTRQSSICAGKSAPISGSPSSISEREDESVH